MSSVINKVTGFVGDIVGGVTGATAAGEAAERGAGTAAAAQRESLEYLKEREALPQQYREEGLGQLAGIYGLEGGDPDALGRLERSPIYQAIMSSADIGEESVLTRASQMGMTRSGDVEYDLADYNARLKQQALMGGLQGIQGMAQLPSMAPQIAEGISGVGQTIAQGQIAKGRAVQEGMGMLISAGAQAAGGTYSDSRLKINVVAKGNRNGHEWFSWDWNRLAKKLGLEGKGEGVIADKVEKYLPEAIKIHQGFKTVDYDMLGV
jgi:hypothetical protein